MRCKIAKTKKTGGPDGLLRRCPDYLLKTYRKRCENVLKTYKVEPKRRKWNYIDLGGETDEEPLPLADEEKKEAVMDKEDEDEELEDDEGEPDDEESSEAGESSKSDDE